MTQTIIDSLAGFAVDTGYDALPSEVVHESKRVLLDSIGCAVAGVRSRKGQIGILFAQSQGADCESTIIGSGQRVSCLGAAFANAETMNALDHEAVLSPGHVQPSLFVPAHLAYAEHLRLSGRDLILATALGLEISTRIGAALPDYRDAVGDRVAVPPVSGFDCAVFGGTAGLCKMMRMDAGVTGEALGISASLAPLPTGGKLVRTYGMPSIKYVVAGWLCQAEITAARLAQMGHSGDTSIFEGEYGFWRLYGSTKWDPERLQDGLGSVWRLRAIRYKNYPCCGGLQSALDCFVSLVSGHGIMPEEIESVEVRLEGFCDEPMFKGTRLDTEADAQFNVAYVLSVAAHRVPVGPAWYGQEAMRNPEILQFMKKVRSGPHPNYAKAIQEDPTSTLSEVGISARGRVFSEERTHHKGSPALQTTRMSDSELMAKFRANASGVLSSDRIDRSIELIMSLEMMEDVSQLTESLR